MAEDAQKLNALLQLPKQSGSAEGALALRTTSKRMGISTKKDVLSLYAKGVQSLHAKRRTVLGATRLWRTMTVHPRLTVYPYYWRDVEGVTLSTNR